MGSKPIDLSKIFVAGINYKKSEAAVRGLLAINSEQYQNIISLAPAFGVSEFFILSTCNRTEIYGLAESEEQLVNLLCTQTKNSKELFLQSAYIKSSMDAIQHLFNVGSGLDSQILGDYEIVGQIKQAVKFSKEQGFISTFLERLVNAVLQASKAIKSQTALSGGTVSVSFAAIQFIKENVTNISDKKILLIGTGKIGRITAKNLVTYLETKNITLINRSEEKAFEAAEEFGLRKGSFENIDNEVGDADIIIVSTNAAAPIITKSNLKVNSSKVLIDLSIPNNIEPALKNSPNIILANVDDLSKINDATLQKRKAEVPKAKQIIAEHIDDLMKWHDMRKHVPVLKSVKQTLSNLREINNPAAVDKAVKNMAVKMQSCHKHGCNYIEVVNNFLADNIN